MRHGHFQRWRDASMGVFHRNHVWDGGARVCRSFRDDAGALAHHQAH